MVGKTGRSGRVAIGGPKVAVQVRLSADEAEALERMVSDRHAAALEVGGSVTNASITRAIIRKALIAEGYLKETALVKKEGKQ